MAHPTSAPFARHSGLPDYPQRHPLSPPETTADSPATAIATPATVPSHLASRNALDHEELAARLSDSPSARFRRVSTLTYNAPTVRDNRERTLQSRPPKPLVIVIPPPTILHEHGQFGHTLSQGPLHRLSQGILMPLFPTIYGQLTAIAREFNFPSTSGLCIYYHFSDGGYVSTPRVSDESWPFISSHVFEERSAVSPPRPPD
ncbi:hypothetical protein ONZ45_g18603 [Pleurotus djamor]|nr:hypothetical protein ONZ45_g18603 [Pleurotus djamor]